MKNIKILASALGLAAAFTAFPAMAQPAANAPRCIDVRNIRDTITGKDNQTLIFNLRNGTTVTNHLKTKCDSLQFGGFVWDTAPGGEVCANAQILRAITTGEICRLGDFSTPVKTAAAAK